jgi:hypothetical protein
MRLQNGRVKALSKADWLRYHLPNANGFSYVIWRNSGDSRDFWRHAVAVFGADTAPMGATVRSGPRALSER